MAGMQQFANVDIVVWNLKFLLHNCHFQMYSKKTNTEVQKQFIMLNYEVAGYHLPLVGNGWF
jgi:hypothetical protein